MFYRSRCLFLSVLALVAFTNAVQAGVTISQHDRSEIISGRIDVKAGVAEHLPMVLRKGDILEITLHSFDENDSKISAYICDEQQADTFKGGQDATCPGFYKQSTPSEVTYTVPHTGNFFLTLDNTHGFLVPKKTGVRIVRNTVIHPKSMAFLQDKFEDLHRKVMQTFEVQDFDITIEPCGMKNASSANDGGHITMCSELVNDIYQRKIYDALEGIFYHELGHTLLNLWNLPNVGNEEVVDEFALVMMFWNGEQQKAIDWMKWHDVRDSARQAEDMIINGRRHPLSIQRVRNAMRILRNPDDVMHRWNQFLYPHLTQSALRDIVNDPPTHGDRELARSLLKN